MPKPKLFATIANIPIYHVHKAGYGNGRETCYIYSTGGDSSNHYVLQFDIRNLGFSDRTLLDLQVKQGIEQGFAAFEDNVKTFIGEQIAKGNIKVPETKSCFNCRWIPCWGSAESFGCFNSNREVMQQHIDKILEGVPDIARFTGIEQARSLAATCPEYEMAEEF